MVGGGQEESEKKSNFAKRLRDARQSLALTQEDLGKMWEKTGNYIYMLERGQKPFPKKLEGRVVDLEREVRKKFGLDKAGEESMVLSEERAVWGNARLDVREGLTKRKVPVVSWAGAAAITEQGLNYADLAYHLDEEVESDTRDPNAFALIVEGDSMEPVLSPGDRVVFAPHEVPRNGDIVVARLRETGAVLLKRYHRFDQGKRVRLESANPEYPPLEYRAEEFRFIYPAVNMVRKWRR